MKFNHIDIFYLWKRSTWESQTALETQINRYTSQNLNTNFNNAKQVKTSICSWNSRGKIILGGARSFCTKRERSGWTKKEDKEPILHESHGNPVAALSERSRFDFFPKCIFIIFLSVIHLRAFVILCIIQVLQKSSIFQEVFDQN